MAQYYYPNGNIINDICGKSAKELFIDLYNHIYYYKINKDRELEKKIDALLENVLLKRNTDELVDIFRWKMGANNYNYSTGIVSNQWMTIDVNEYTDVINQVLDIKEIMEEDLPAILQDLIA